MNIDDVLEYQNSLSGTSFPTANTTLISHQVTSKITENAENNFAIPSTSAEVSDVSYEMGSFSFQSEEIPHSPTTIHVPNSSTYEGSNVIATIAYEDQPIQCIVVPPKTTENFMILKKEHLRTYYFDVRSIAPKVFDQLQNDRAIDEKDRNLIIKSLADSIYEVNPNVKREKIKEISLNFTMMFKQFIDHDGNGKIKGEGYECLAQSLETKLNHKRRTNPVFNLDCPRQLPRNKTKIDNIFQADEEKRKQFLETASQDILVTMAFLKETFLYQRFDINCTMRDNMNDVSKGWMIVKEKWKMMLVSQLYLLFSKLFCKINSKSTSAINFCIYVFYL